MTKDEITKAARDRLAEIETLRKSLDEEAAGLRAMLGEGPVRFVPLPIDTMPWQPGPPWTLPDPPIMPYAPPWQPNPQWQRPDVTCEPNIVEWPPSVVFGDLPIGHGSICVSSGPTFNARSPGGALS